jgi:hypothetical protein
MAFTTALRPIITDARKNVAVEDKGKGVNVMSGGLGTRDMPSLMDKKVAFIVSRSLDTSSPRNMIDVREVELLANRNELVWKKIAGNSPISP